MNDTGSQVVPPSRLRMMPRFPSPRFDLNAGGTSRVTIHSAGPIDSDAVKAAVEEAGYTLAGSPA
ncbi:hypothetical protein GCM10027071_30170 [Microbacterium marinum]